MHFASPRQAGSMGAVTTAHLPHPAQIPGQPTQGKLLPKSRPFCFPGLVTE